MEIERPSPEVMLARASVEGVASGRGRLKIFFGMAPGVGKTYALLEAAHAQQRAGIDVVLGWIETHGRPETERLCRGFEALKPRIVDYRGLELSEFDLEAALRRKPQLILLDELAHSNAAGSRHARRWQDARELLAAGIDVYTTLNVQHVESLNDVVASITGVVVRETVPDVIVDEAHEVELVDITPDELLQRLKDGKVYVPAQAERATQSFFKKGNLLALRELALRRTTERVDAQNLEWRRAHGVPDVWGTRERILVCVGPGPSAANVVRAAYRLATRLRAPWMAVVVETPGFDRLEAESREGTGANLALAQSLGAETIVVHGENASEEILAVARERSATKIVVGKPDRKKRFKQRNIVANLLRGPADIDVLVTAGTQDAGEAPRFGRVLGRGRLRDYLISALCIGIASGVCAVLNSLFSVADKAMVYLLAVLLVASRMSLGPSLLAATLSVAALNFMFVPPRFTFSVSDESYWLTFTVMLLVGILVSTITSRIKAREATSRERERVTARLHVMGSQFSVETSVAKIASAAVHHTRELLGVDAVVLLADRSGRLTPCGGGDVDLARTDAELAVARWVFQNGRLAGYGTDTLPGSNALFIPLVGTTGHLGTFGIALGLRKEPPTPSQWRIVETFVVQTALALERALLAKKAEEERLAADRERTRSGLLSAVSHDVRTPLASITGAASTLAAQPGLSPTTRLELVHVIQEESEHLTRLINGILDVTRIESGDLQLKLEPYPLEEIVDSATQRLSKELEHHPVSRTQPEEVILVHADPVLLEQVAINVLENAAKYSPPSSPIEIHLDVDAEVAWIEIADRGPGLPEGQEQRIFERFFRANGMDGVRGTGMGLAICEAILRAHGGRIDARNREGGGSVFRIVVPRAGSASANMPREVQA